MTDTTPYALRFWRNIEIWLSESTDEECLEFLKIALLELKRRVEIDALDAERVFDVATATDMPLPHGA